MNVFAQVLCCVDKQGILSWPNPSPETVLFFSGRVEPPHDSQEDLRDDLSINSYCRIEQDDEVPWLLLYSLKLCTLIGPPWLLPYAPLVLLSHWSSLALRFHYGF